MKNIIFSILIGLVFNSISYAWDIELKWSFSEYEKLQEAGTQFLLLYKNNPSSTEYVEDSDSQLKEGSSPINIKKEMDEDDDPQTVRVTVHGANLNKNYFFAVIAVCKEGYSVISGEGMVQRPFCWKKITPAIVTGEHVIPGSVNIDIPAYGTVDDELRNAQTNGWAINQTLKKGEIIKVRFDAQYSGAEASGPVAIVLKKFGRIVSGERMIFVRKDGGQCSAELASPIEGDIDVCAYPQKAGQYLFGNIQTEVIVPEVSPVAWVYVKQIKKSGTMAFGNTVIFDYDRCNAPPTDYLLVGIAETQKKAEEGVFIYEYTSDPEGDITAEATPRVAQYGNINTQKGFFLVIKRVYNDQESIPYITGFVLGNNAGTAEEKELLLTQMSINDRDFALVQAGFSDRLNPAYAVPQPGTWPNDTGEYLNLGIEQNCPGFEWPAEANELADVDNNGVAGHLGDKMYLQNQINQRFTRLTIW